MNKRLRKKKRRGEFTVWGRQLIIARNRTDEFDKFFDDFIVEAIEGSGCRCGGGGHNDQLDVVVELGCLLDDPDTKLNQITAWLHSRRDVKEWQVGNMFDIWYEDYEDILCLPPLATAGGIRDAL